MLVRACEGRRQRPCAVPRHVLVLCHILVPQHAGACHVVVHHVHHILVPIVGRATSSCHAASLCRAVSWCSSSLSAMPHPRATLCSHAHCVPMQATSSCHAASSCLPCCHAPRPSHPHAHCVPLHVLVPCRVLVPSVSLCPLCPCATPRPHATLRPDAHRVLVPIMSPCCATSSCHAASSCPPHPCVHRVLVPMAMSPPRRVSACFPPPPPGSVRCRCLVTARGRPRRMLPVALLQGWGRPCSPSPQLGCRGVPGVPGHHLTPLLPAEALVNSQEWTLGRSVPEIRLVGTVSPCPCPGSSCPRPP